MAEITERFVDSGDGVRIAVYEEGNPDGPTVVMAHGWPDSHVLWDGVVPLLADRFRVIRYDNRGVGQSSVPKPVSAYTMARFADDFAAVIDASRPASPCTCWPTTGGRSGCGSTCAGPARATASRRSRRCPGPSADHLAGYIVGGLKARIGRRRSAGARSGDRVGYMVWLSVPVLAPLAVRRSMPPGSGAGWPAATAFPLRRSTTPRRTDPTPRTAEDLPRPTFFARPLMSRATTTSTCRCS